MLASQTINKTPFSLASFVEDRLPKMDFEPSMSKYLTASQKDMLYNYQLHLSNPFNLDEGSLEAAMIVDTKSNSRAAFHGLRKAGIIADDGSIITDKIDRQFKHHLAVLGLARLYQTVDLLFWWEAQTVRLQTLMAEKESIETQLRAVGEEEKEEYVRLLERVERKIKTVPSKRDAVEEANQDELMLRAQSVGN